MEKKLTTVGRKKIMMNKSHIEIFKKGIRNIYRVMAPFNFGTKSYFISGSQSTDGFQGRTK